MVARAKRRKQRVEIPSKVPVAAPVPSYILPCALMFVGVFLLYAGTYYYPLVFDDRFINRIQLPDFTASCAKLSNRCLSNTTFGLTYLAAGLDLLWFRVGNVLCHALAALACFVFFTHLFEAARGQQPDRG